MKGGQTPRYRRILAYLKHAVGGLALAEVAAADLDVAVARQLPATQLALCDQLKPSPLQMIRLKAFLL